MRRCCRGQVTLCCRKCSGGAKRGAALAHQACAGIDKAGFDQTEARPTATHWEERVAEHNPCRAEAGGLPSGFAKQDSPSRVASHQLASRFQVECSRGARTRSEQVGLEGRGKASHGASQAAIEHVSS